MVARLTEVDIIECCMIDRLISTHKTLCFDLRRPVNLHFHLQSGVYLLCGYHKGNDRALWKYRLSVAIWV